MKDIAFSIPGRGREDHLTIEKPFTFVLGGNGTGKSTCAKRIFEKDPNHCFLFNLDFIQKNVFVTSEEGENATISSDNKTSFTNLFIGADAVDQEKALNAAKVAKKECANEEEAQQNKFDKALADSKLPSRELRLFLDGFESKTSFDFTKTFKDNLAVFTLAASSPDPYHSEEDFQTALDRYNNDELTKTIVNAIKKDALLFSIISTGKLSDELRNDITNYNDNLSAMIECDKAFSSSNDSKFHEWIEEGVRLHTNTSSCLFCHSSNVKQSVEEWKGKLTEKGTASRKALRFAITTFQSQIESFSNSFGDNIIKLLPKLGKSVGDFQKFLLEIQESLAKRVQIDIEKFPTLSVDPSVQDSAKQYDSLCKHILLKGKFKYFAPFSFEKSINDKILSTQKALDDSLEKTARDSKSQINNFLVQMKSGIQISVSQNNAAGNRKLSLERDTEGSNFGTYSDGELHQIALAVFLSNLQRKKPEKSVIVFDDPVVSLDISKYHSFRNCLFDLKLTQTGSNQIVILTHNFHFMLVLLSMFIDGGDLKKFDIMDLWAAGGNGFKKIEDPESITYDDFTLFGKAALQCSTYPEFVRLEWLLQRFPRVALDLKLRFYCQTSGQDPAKDLESIFTMDPAAETKKDELLFISDAFSKRLHDNKLPDPRNFQSEVVSVQSFFRLLGLPEPFTSVDLTNIVKISMPANESDISLNNEAPLVFRIIDSAKALYDLGDESFKAYFRHPRYQITESILNTVGTADSFSH